MKNLESTPNPTDETPAKDGLDPEPREEEDTAVEDQQPPTAPESTQEEEDLQADIDSTVAGVLESLREYPPESQENLLWLSIARLKRREPASKTEGDPLGAKERPFPPYTIPERYGDDPRAKLAFQTGVETSHRWMRYCKPEFRQMLVEAKRREVEHIPIEDEEETPATTDIPLMDLYIDQLDAAKLAMSYTLLSCVWYNDLMHKVRKRLLYRLNLIDTDEGIRDTFASDPQGRAEYGFWIGFQSAAVRADAEL